MQKLWRFHIVVMAILVVASLFTVGAGASDSTYGGNNVADFNTLPAAMWGQWIFDQAHVSSNTLSAVHGLPGKLNGPADWIDSSSGRWYSVDGRSNNVTVYSGRPEKLTPPTQDITIEAWVMAETISDYRGIIGYIQDNGSYEHGWWLGIYDGKFTFALASKGKQLTLLKANTAVEKNNGVMSPLSTMAPLCKFM